MLLYLLSIINMIKNIPICSDVPTGNPDEEMSCEINISEIEFDLHSRDEIPKMLIGLQLGRSLNTERLLFRYLFIPMLNFGIRKPSRFWKP